MITKLLTRFFKDNIHSPQATLDTLEAFEKLKCTLLSTPILRTLNWKKPFLVFTDASREGVGVTLTQFDEGYDHSIYYAGRQLSSGEINDTLIEREGIGIIFALNKFRHYLLETKTTMVRDHQTLIYFLNISNTIVRIVQWISLFQEFDFKIVHNMGTKHINVDFYSRL